MTGKKFAVFDIDGTLIRWQLYHAVVDRLAKQHLLGPMAQNMLHNSRMVWKRRIHADAFRDYESELIKIYESALSDLRPEVFDTTVKDIAAEYKDQVYTYTRELALKYKEKGFILLAISGSHQEVVEQVASLYGFDAVEGTRYTRTNDRFSGEKFVPSLDKSAVLQKLITQFDLSLNGSIAVGDSGSDISILQMVENPIAFNPDRVLFEAAKVNGWKIVVERKNMVYELLPSGGSYTLS